MVMNVGYNNLDALDQTLQLTLEESRKTPQGKHREVSTDVVKFTSVSPGSKKLTLDPVTDHNAEKDTYFKESVKAAMAYPMIFSPVTMPGDHKWYNSAEERQIQGQELDMDTIYKKCQTQMKNHAEADNPDYKFKIVFDVILLDSEGSDNLDAVTPGGGKAISKLAQFMGHLQNNVKKDEVIDFRMLLNPKLEDISNHDFMDFSWTSSESLFTKGGDDASEQMTAISKDESVRFKHYGLSEMVKAAKAKDLADAK